MASFLPGYAAEIADEECRLRYTSKSAIIKNIDPYEIPKGEYKDDVDMWPYDLHSCWNVSSVYSQSLYRRRFTEL